MRKTKESGLSDMTRIPLLAMIAAVVYQQSPESDLPMDRAGLYEQFHAITTTLTEVVRRLPETP